MFCCSFKWTEIPAALHFRLLLSSENRKRRTEGRPSRAGPQTNSWKQTRTNMKKTGNTDWEGDGESLSSCECVLELYVVCLCFWWYF